MTMKLLASVAPESAARYASLVQAQAALPGLDEKTKQPFDSLEGPGP
jgi:hypothetical protein